MDMCDGSSQEVLETIPLVMQAIRREMRRQRKPDLSVPQFRTLAFLHHYPGSSLSQVAGHVGLTLSSMSRTIDGLVGRGLVLRDTRPEDRRSVGLTLTPAGRSILLSAEKGAQSRLAELLGSLSDKQRTVVAEALRALRGVFTAN